MSIEAWSFLVSRNRYLDYRTIVAPAFICDAGVPNLLARAADGDLTEPGSAICRKIESPNVENFTIVFRITNALGEYINSENKNEFLKDSFGREIYLIEGVVIKGEDKVSVASEDLEKVHGQVKTSYLRFWDCEKAPPVEAFSSFKVESSESSSRLRLEEMNPLIISNQGKVLEDETWKINKKVSAGFRVSSIAFSPAGKEIAIRGYNPFVDIRSLDNYECIALIDKRLSGLINFDATLSFDNDRAVAFSPDGKLIASSVIQGTDCNNILLWNVDLRKEEITLKGHRISPFGRIHSISFSRDGKLLASASQDATIKLWDVLAGEQYASLQHQNPVCAVSFSPEGSTLVSGDNKGCVEFWDIKNRLRLDIIQAREISSINSIAFNSDGSMLAVAGNGEWLNGIHLQIWDANAKKVIHLLTGHSDPVKSVVFSPDSQTLASGSEDGSVKIWDVNSGKELLTLSEKNYQGVVKKITSVAFSPNGQILASSSIDGTITIWKSFV
jgi:WD40 repeat protein